ALRFRLARKPMLQSRTNEHRWTIPLGGSSRNSGAKGIGLGLSCVEGAWTCWGGRYRGRQERVQRVPVRSLRRQQPPQVGAKRFWNGWTTDGWGCLRCG